MERSCRMLLHFFQNEKEEYAFLKRANTSWMNGLFCVPAGKVGKGEFFSEAAIREAQEEVGVTVRRSDLKHVLTMHYLDKNDENKNPEWVNIYFLVEEWEGALRNNEPDVHSELAWARPGMIEGKMVPGLSEALAAIQDGKAYLEFKQGGSNG